MKRVYKYELSGTDNIISLPLNSKILSVGVQHDIVNLWVLVDPNETTVELRKFKVYGTGHDIMDDINDLQFIDTVHLFNSTLIFHIFEQIN